MDIKFLNGLTALNLHVFGKLKYLHMFKNKNTRNVLIKLLTLQIYKLIIGKNTICC